MPAPIPADRIFDAVLAIWREHGYAAATTVEIARRANVGEVTLYRRFGDKATLFAAALARESQFLGDAAPRFTGDVERDLLGVVTAYDAMVIRNAAIILDFLRSAPHTDELANAAPSPLVAIGRLAAIIQLHQAAGNLREGDPHTQLAELLGPVLLKRLLADAQPTLALSDDLISFVQRYLYGRAPSGRR
ncbi:MAG: TetR/AcrR family transcriptional regulator [Actinomycetia bacterium]|nr:TetR/AcrR family transcriptional regulator [Actinomycetes bacterium]